MKSDVKITGQRLQITHVFDAPRPRVFAEWSRADRLQQWSGCKEATKCEVTADFRPGGAFTQIMQIAGAGEFTITGHYDEIVEPEKIAYRANLGAFATVRVLVEFFEQGNQTRVVLTQEGLADENIRKTVSLGTTESFGKLESLLAAAKELA